MNKDNDFDDFDLGDLVDNEDDSGLNFDDNFGDSLNFNENLNNNMNNISNNGNNVSIEDKSNIFKTAITAIVVGILLILVVFIIMRSLKGNKTNEVNLDTNNVTNTRYTVNNQQIQPIEQSGWKEVNVGSEIIFNSEYVDTEFVVTDLKNYIKIIYNIDNKKEIMIKTVVRGRLVGFDGDYELELPYYKGSKLKIGNKFSVKVQVGDYKGIRVIGEIIY